MNLPSNFLAPVISQNFSIGTSAYRLLEQTIIFSAPNLLMNLADVSILARVISISSI